MLSRRHVLICLAATACAPAAHADPGYLSVAVAHRAAQDGAVLLIDIRTPDEWAATGLGAGALPLDMRRPDFLAELDRLMEGDRSRPLAIICATGVRSARVATALRRIGYGNVADVSEGMMGSASGPGWLRTGLPVVPAPR